MGGDKDTVTASGAADSLNITLGDAADTFKYSGAFNTKGITVGGQGGADTFTLNEDASARANYYGGGQGADTFTGTIQLQTSIVGGSENDKVGASGTGVEVGALTFINGQVGADKIYVDLIDANSTNTTVRGGSEADTIVLTNTAGTASADLFGDKGADTITGAGGVDNIDGGGGADRIDAGVGGGKVKLGDGNDTVIASNAAATAAAKVSDFVKADDMIGFSVGSMTLQNGNDADVAAGADVVSQSIDGSAYIGVTTNVIKYTGTAVADVTNLTSALNAYTVLAAGALADSGDTAAFIVEYTDTSGDQKYAYSLATVGSNAAVTFSNTKDLVNVGDAEATTANLSFVA